ncbi:hypothetical protein [Micromonospora sp. D75]|uniref:hypothetical protein n=1 Tax=Micromonospora sp. D75 TaxID=2824885 RepID=UPI001FFD6D2F|nr:hypothetical protein [Micromonospora sp. D75]
MWLIDLDEYRRGPLVLDSGRLPGSRRYLPPEELTLGATVDDRLTAHALGRTLRHPLDGLSGWRGTTAERAVVARATRADPAARHATVAALIGPFGDPSPGQVVTVRHPDPDAAHRHIQ